MRKISNKNKNVVALSGTEEFDVWKYSLLVIGENMGDLICHLDCRTALFIVG